MNLYNNLKEFRHFVGEKVWRYFLTSILIGFVWFLVESSFIFVLQSFLLSIGLLAEKQVFLPSWFPRDFAFSIFILIFFGLARAAVFMLKAHFANQTQMTFIYEQRLLLLSYGLRNAGTISSKSLLSAFTEIMNQSGIVLYYLTMLINTIISTALFFILGVRLAPIEMIVGVSVLLIFMLPLKIINHKIDNLGKNLVKESEAISDILLKGLKNYFFLLIYNQVEKELKNGEQSLKNFKSNYMKYSLVSSISSSMPLFLGVLVLSVVTYVSIKHINTDAIKLVSFFYIFIRLAQSASEINGTLASIKLNFAGLKILHNWKKKVEESKKINNLEIVKIKKEEIYLSFENVSFYYDPKNRLLESINFNVGPGDVLVIKGESGVGKSTILSLILSINLPKKGSVKINNHDTKNIQIEYEDILGYVGPEPYLISGTIKENLMYGFESKLSIDDSEFIKVLNYVELSELIKKFDNGINEHLSEVANLSTGQKQRISIARAILRKPKLLILDEATANLDQETEGRIINNLKHLLFDTTTVVVTHKDSFDAVATKIIRLGNKI